MQHWSLDVQRQLGSSMVFSVGYYGSKGTHLVGVTEINDLPPGLALSSMCAPGNNTPATVGVTLVKCQTPGYAFRNSATTAAQGNTNVVGATLFTDNAILDQLRPYRGYRSITMLQPRYNSNYHSLQMYMQKRFSGASQLSASYTWSKNLTDSQNDRSNAPQNTFDFRSEYSRATLDRRRRVDDHVSLSRSPAGQELTREEQSRLLERWRQTANPHACAHNRPVYFRLALDEVRRKIGRTGLSCEFTVSRTA